MIQGASTMRRLAVGWVVLGLFPVYALAQEQTGIPFDLMFHPGNQQSMGLQKLTPAEREALRRRVESLLLMVRAGLQAPKETTSGSKRVSIPLPPSGPQWPAQQQPRTQVQTVAPTQPPQFQAPRTVARPAPPSNLYAGVGGGHWVRDNLGPGEFIRLEDGSLWKIDPLDKVDAYLWLIVSKITVIESSDGSPGYDYLLINADDRGKTHAKYLGQR
jgi:hypothetical protein